MYRVAWRTLLCAVLLQIASRTAEAQVRPDLEWRTLANERFRVHFTPELETLARRTLANAEWAYEQLARELPKPRGLVDIVVADNVDYANGYATPYPSNRIVVYARPPVDEPTLRNHADWNRMLVTHELVHIFHLDRVGGLWKLGQRVFGRAAPLFPNRYAPSWLVEGIAVHYETRLTGAGRLAGTEFPALVRALAESEAIPTLDAVVTPRPFFPGGNAPYLLGSFLVDRAVRSNTAQTPGESMGRLIDRMSGNLIPWRLDAAARRAFGASFSAQYAQWRDSVHAAGAEVVAAKRAAYLAEVSAICGPLSACVTAAPVPGPVGWNVASPRFGPDGVLRFVSDDARRMPGLYELEGGRAHRLARRNSVDANAPLDSTRVVYSEWDRTDPYSVRSDLYVGEGGARRRLSTDERLASPDVHVASGRVVALRTEPGTTDLVVFDDIDGTARVLARGTLDRTWTDPRWSRDGEYIAASRWDRGGRTSVVVMDRAGRERQRFAPRVTASSRFPLVGAPVWLPGDTLLLFTSDHEGRSQVYVGDVRSGAYALFWSTTTALRFPDISGDGSRLVALELRADGWEVVLRGRRPLDSLLFVAPTEDRVNEVVESPAIDTLEFADRYRARPTLAPTWWLPAVDRSDEQSWRVGLLTGGSDVLGRHAWQLEARQDLERPELSGSAGYAWAGLGNPVLSIGVDQEWVHGAIVDTAGGYVGSLGRRTSTFRGSVYAVRPRVRLTTYAIIAPELAIRSYRTYPITLIGQLNEPELLDIDVLPSVALSVGVSTMQRPGLSVSVEDGFAAQSTWRTRFNGGPGGRSVYDAIVEASAAKSLPLPGYARHVFAVRAVQGFASEGTSSVFEVGGVSGSALEVLPGLAVGGTRRTFFVRGFAPGTAIGNRAAAGSVEYRAPLARVGRGVGLVPASLRTLSALVFADAGSAWCSDAADLSPFCTTFGPSDRWLGSVGGELIFDTALQYDTMYRMRLGLAAPVQGRELASRRVTLYFTFGSTF